MHTEFPVISDAGRIVIADLGSGAPTGVARQARERCVRAAEKPPLRFDKFVLHMPKTPTAEVDIHVFSALARRGRRLYYPRAYERER